MSETASTISVEAEMVQGRYGAKDMVISIVICLKRLLIGFVAEMSAMEYLFIKMYHIYSFLCQLFFLTLCEVAIVRPKQAADARKEERMVTGLTTLLFYSVFGYFVSRVRDISASETQSTGPARTASPYRDYVYWIFKLAIEWAKAIVIVVCLREQGLNYRPDLAYNAVTFLYYLLTERITAETMENLITMANLSFFDSMEYLYVPIVFKSLTALASAVLVGSLLRTPYAKYALLSSYFLLYLNLKDLLRNYVQPLVVEKRTYASFRMASGSDLESWDDICAVCLNKMSQARITPCNHLFHPHCLKRCLKNSLQCPLCKQNFVLSS